ncbi:AI-2E family transporter [Aeromonas bivalvium]
MIASLENRSFMLALAIISGFFIWMLLPFFSAIFWACMIGVLFLPINEKIRHQFKLGKNGASLLTLLLCVVVLIVPVLFLGWSFMKEINGLYQTMQAGKINFGEYLDTIKTSFPALHDIMSSLGIDYGEVRNHLTNAVVFITRYIAQHAFSVGQGAFSLILDICIMLYVAFFMIRDGQHLVEKIIHALPLGNRRERLMLAKFSEVARATMKGNFAVAILQGLLGGIIFAVLGIQGPIIWGVVMTLLSMIPVVGAGLIWGPVAVYLFASGNLVDAVILTLFGALVIGLVDNILRPILVGRDTKMPDYLILLSTLGGIIVFGINGFVLGPIIAALFTTTWLIFADELGRDSQLDDSHPQP